MLGFIVVLSHFNLSNIEESLAICRAIKNSFFAHIQAHDLERVFPFYIMGLKYRMTPKFICVGDLAMVYCVKKFCIHHHTQTSEVFCCGG